MSDENEMWATVELMGHAQTSGRISRPSDWGGLLRVDVPLGDGYRTEYYGLAAIYSVKIVSEDIARAYARPSHDVVAYDTPIITREQHQKAINDLERCLHAARNEAEELRRRLTSVNALPAGKSEPDPLGFPDGDSPEEDEDDRTDDDIRF